MGQSYQKALEYYQKASDLGNSSAMINLAFLYKEGKGVEKSDEKAIEYSQKAANLGNTDAQKLLKRLNKK